ncbi:MAG: formylglycine-generating enzyme family protein [Blastocatellia bacterium]
MKSFGQLQRVKPTAKFIRLPRGGVMNDRAELCGQTRTTMKIMKTKRTTLIGLSAAAAALIVLLLFVQQTPVTSLAQSDFPPKKPTLAPRPPRSNPTLKPRPPRKKTTPKPGPTSSPTLRSAQLVSMLFTTARVDRYGNVTRIPGRTVSGFVEDLGNGVKLEMVKIPGGVFDMGSPVDERGRSDDEVLRRGVRVNGVFIGKFEVTQAQWKSVMGDNLNLHFTDANLPMEQVSWENAVEFCRRLSRRTDRQYRLPTEAEWEYAARAGARTPFAFGETITPEIVNYNGNFPYRSVPRGEYRERIIPVGSLGVANAFGLFDMHGNVWEWCEDWYGPYDPNQLNNPKGSASGSQRVQRGGAWNDYGSNCRSAFRGIDAPFGRSLSVGFRVMCVSARTT